MNNFGDVFRGFPSEDSPSSVESEITAPMIHVTTNVVARRWHGGKVAEARWQSYVSVDSFQRSVAAAQHARAPERRTLDFYNIPHTEYITICFKSVSFLFSDVSISSRPHVPLLISGL